MSKSLSYITPGVQGSTASLLRPMLKYFYKCISSVLNVPERNIFQVLHTLINTGVDKYDCFIQINVYFIVTIQNNEKCCPEYCPENFKGTVCWGRNMILPAHYVSKQ